MLHFDSGNVRMRKKFYVNTSDDNLIRKGESMKNENDLIPAGIIMGLFMPPFPVLEKEAEKDIERKRGEKDRKRGKRSKRRKRGKKENG